MSEYTKRILAFSAVAIVLGIGISIGIASLPMSMVAQTGTTSVSSTTQTASSYSSVVSSETTIGTIVSSMSTTTSYYSSSPSSSITQTAITSTTVSCVVSAYPDGIFLRVLTNSGAPISGLAVSGQSVYTVNGGTCANPISSTTNSTGWAYLGSNPGYYYASVSDSGTGYNLTIPSRPVSESIATYYLPSGNLTIVYCTNGNPLMCSS